MTAACGPDERQCERTVTRVIVKRNNPTLLDVYGHWWVEIDGIESYGWWPAAHPVGIANAFRGVAGVLNGPYGPNGGSPTTDPRHGELADHAFHPVTVGGRSDDQIAAAIHRFAATFDGGWRWSIRPAVNCRSFQADLLAAAGLVVPDGYAHSAGPGCPFLAPPRRWGTQLAHRLTIRRTDLGVRVDAASFRSAVKDALILCLVSLVVVLAFGTGYRRRPSPKRAGPAPSTSPAGRGPPRPAPIPSRPSP